MAENGAIKLDRLDIDLALTYGLVEAIVIQILMQCNEKISIARLQTLLPIQLRRQADALKEIIPKLIGLELLEECAPEAGVETQVVRLVSQANSYLKSLAVSDLAASDSASTEEANGEEATLMTADWTLGESWLELLQQRGVKLSAIDRELPIFRQYWIDRCEVRRVWGHVFFQRMMTINRGYTGNTSQIDSQWRPALAIQEYLCQDFNMPMAEVEKQIQAFIHIQSESQALSDDWNRRFLQYMQSIQGVRVVDSFPTLPQVQAQKNGYTDDGGLDVDSLTYLASKGISSEFAKASARNFARQYDGNSAALSASQWSDARLKFIMSAFQKKSVKSAENNRHITGINLDGFFKIAD